MATVSSDRVLLEAAEGARAIRVGTAGSLELQPSRALTCSVQFGRIVIRIGVAVPLDQERDVDRRTPGRDGSVLQREVSGSTRVQTVKKRHRSRSLIRANTGEG